MCPLALVEYTGLVFFWLVGTMALLVCLHSWAAVHFFDCALFAEISVAPPQGILSFWVVLAVGMCGLLQDISCFWDVLVL